MVAKLNAAVLVAILLTATGQTLPPTPQPGMDSFQCTFGDSGTTVTKTSGECNGWSAETVAECFEHCYKNELPSACSRPVGYQCSTVIYQYDPDPSNPWNPGWCHNTNSSCVTINTTSDVYLFENVTSDMFACLSGTCVAAADGGVPKDVCERICLNPDAKYVCVHGKCEVSTDPNKGVDRSSCEAICQPDAE
jgi:hypothetical protein